MSATLALGFDAGCITCTGLAENLRHQIGDKVQVISLTSPLMTKWRSEAIGDGAPWAPTLVRIDAAGHVEAWTGWQIAPILSRELGPKSTWAVLNTLGGYALNGDGQRPSRLRNTLSRSTFLRFGAGAALGTGILAFNGGSAFARTKAPQTGPPTGGAVTARSEDVREMSGEELEATARRLLASTDVANIDSIGPSLATASASVGTATAAASPLRPMTTSSTSDTGGGVQVYASEITRAEGVTQTGVVAFFPDTKTMLVSVEHSAPIDGTTTYAQRYSVDDSDPLNPAFLPVGHSFDGETPDFIDLNDTATLMSGAAPCNTPSCCPSGPGSRGRRLAQICDGRQRILWQCLTGAGSCATCISGTPAFTWAAMGCAVLSCPSAVASCCPNFRTACTRCSCPT